MSKTKFKLLVALVALIFGAGTAIVGCGEDPPPQTDENDTNNDTNDGNQQNDDQDDGEDQNNADQNNDEQPEDLLTFESDRSISELDDEEAQQLCDEEIDYTPYYMSEENWNRINCLYQMSNQSEPEDEGPVEYCDENFDQCMEDGPEFDLTEQADGDCKFTEMDRDDCQATIGEFEDCLDEQNESFEDSVQDLDCEDADDLGDAGTGERGEACQQFVDNCPGYD